MTDTPFEALKHHLRELDELTSWRFLDVGAHLGNFYASMLETFPKAVGVCIEPNPHSRRRLEHDHAVRAYAWAASDQYKTTTMYTRHDKLDSSGASLYIENRANWLDSERVKEFRVEAYPLDMFFARESFELVKLDTQGSELDIIRGGEQTIRNCRYLLVETQLVEYNRGAPFQQEVCAAIHNLGFEQVALVEDHIDKQSTLVQQDILFRNAA